MNKYKYRIKTEKEFIDEFGSTWRSVRCSFTDSMDFMLGKEIYQKDYIDYIDGGRLLLNRDLIFNFCGWNVSGQMIKEVKIGVDYNEKRTLVYD